MKPIRLHTILHWAGIALLASALFVGWYSVTGEGGNSGMVENFYLFGVQFTGPSTSWTSSYSSAFFSETGTLYQVVAALLIAAIVLGIGVGGVVLLSGRRERTILMLLLSCAVVGLALAAPVLLWAAQPAAVCSDSQHFSPPLAGPHVASGDPSCTWSFYLGGGTWVGAGQAGPGGSFFGESSGNIAWGPAAGWYLALLGSALVGIATGLRHRKDRPTRPVRHAVRRAG